MVRLTDSLGITNLRSQPVKLLLLAVICTCNLFATAQTHQVEYAYVSQEEFEKVVKKTFYLKKGCF